LIIDENDPRDEPIQNVLVAWMEVIKLRDAHDHDEIVYGYMKARLTLRKPTCIWAPTKIWWRPFRKKPEYDDVVFPDSDLEISSFVCST
jgi:hypothetical protein